MTPEQLKKEQEEAAKIKPMQSIQPDLGSDADGEKSPELKQFAPAKEITPSPSLDRKSKKQVQDYNTIVQESKAKGIDLNNQEGVPLLESDKESMIQNFQKLAPKEFVSNVVNRINTYAKPELKDVPKIDVKRQLDLERKQRRSKWADALYAFGEGLQGKTADQNNFAQNKIQRKQDEDFQNYKEATEYNRQARNLWNKQVSDETLKWLDEQSRNQQLDSFTREKMKEAADQYRQNMAFNEKELKQQKQIADDRNRAAITEAGIRANATDKTNKPIVIKTAQKTYELEPEEADFYKSQFLQNVGKYASKFPGIIVKVQKTDDWGKPIEGQFEYKLTKPIKDTDLIRSVIEENELNERRNFTSNLFDKGSLTQKSQVQAKKPSLFQ